MQLRRAVIGNESVLRGIRLMAMSDAPHAFCSTYERESARTTLEWQRWMSPGVTFILDAGSNANGIVAGQRDANEPGVVHLMALWVHPQIRGTGAADVLVTAILTWAKSQGGLTLAEN